jgi:hypothetical protein
MGDRSRAYRQVSFPGQLSDASPLLPIERAGVGPRRIVPGARTESDSCSGRGNVQVAMMHRMAERNGSYRKAAGSGRFLHGRTHATPLRSALCATSAGQCCHLRGNFFPRPTRTSAAGFLSNAVGTMPHNDDSLAGPCSSMSWMGMTARVSQRGSKILIGCGVRTWPHAGGARRPAGNEQSSIADAMQP